MQCSATINPMIETNMHALVEQLKNKDQLERILITVDHFVNMNISVEQLKSKGNS